MRPRSVFTVLLAAFVVASCALLPASSEGEAYARLTRDLNPRYVTVFRDLDAAGADVHRRQLGYQRWADLDAEYVARLREMRFGDAANAAADRVIDLIEQEESALRQAGRATDITAMDVEMGRVRGLEPALTEALNALRRSLQLPTLAPAPSG